jgi:hypothetical protein
MVDCSDHPDWMAGDAVTRFAIEVHAAGDDATQLLNGMKPVQCRLCWHIAPAQAGALDGVFRLRVFAEAIGASFSCAVGEAHAAAEPGRLDYQLGILMPAGTLPGGGHHPDHPGLYRLTCVLQYRSRAMHPLIEFGASAQRTLALYGSARL